MNPFEQGFYDALEKTAGALDLYIVGPGGSGKTTLADKYSKTHTIIHLDDYQLKNQGKKRIGHRWSVVRRLIEESKKPVVVEGISVNPALARKAKKKLLLNPSLGRTLLQRLKRGATPSERPFWGNDDPRTGWRRHRRWQQFFLPGAKKAGFQPADKVTS
ncbi:MAG: hypothetical protein KKC03_13265 [Bacteroidetes bacterium]|nr:hypothetical protein [Bacteroidota bacterium]